MWPGKVHILQLPRDSVEPLSISPVVFDFLLMSGTMGPSRPALSGSGELVRVMGASPSFLKGSGRGGDNGGQAGQKRSASPFLGLQIYILGQTGMQPLPCMLIIVLTFTVVPVGFLRALPGPSQGRTLRSQREQKASQVSKWISGTHSGGNIHLKIKIFLTCFGYQETNPEGLYLNVLL